MLFFNLKNTSLTVGDVRHDIVEGDVRIVDRNSQHRGRQAPRGKLLVFLDEFYKFLFFIFFSFFLILGKGALLENFEKGVIFSMQMIMFLIYKNQLACTSSTRQSPTREVSKFSNEIVSSPREQNRKSCLRLSSGTLAPPRTW